MSFKKFLRYATSALVIGAILILGFLAFSGIYVLTPILGLCIAAFILSVVFEGEIYYQNINKAIKSLIKPYYIESKLAEECLQEAIGNINKELNDDLNYDYRLINTIDSLINSMYEFENAPTNRKQSAENKIKRNYIQIQKLINLQKAEPKLKETREYLKEENFLNEEAINDYLTNAVKSSETPQIFCSTDLFAATANIYPIKEKLIALKNTLVSNHVINIPQFFIDYAQIVTIDHKFSHINPNKAAEKHKKTLQVSLSIMEQIFTEQLFPHTQAKNTAGSKWWWFGRKKKAAAKKSNPNYTQDCEGLSPENTFGHDKNSVRRRNLKAPNKGEDEYKQKLREYLAAFYVEKYNKMLPKRKFGSKFIKVLSVVCAGLMILGTSYLLVEAFAVVPLLAAIPFGALPAVIVPLAVLAGIAYGLQTYRALDEILNSDVITQRIAKIKADIKNGLNLYTGAKLVIFFALLGLAITLTICTGGTWYTILKNTKPLFSWLSKIPKAVVGVIAGFLAVASFAFNISNSAQTAEELEEAIESEVPEDNPYNIDLFDLGDNGDVEKDIEYVPSRLAIIKKGEKYYIHCCPPGETAWQRIEVREKSLLLKGLLRRLNFKQSILYHSVLNSGLYSLIRNETRHKFNPSKENWTQFLNPFRIFLLFTYVPVRIVFFLGHLASISATADRIPGIPDIISMMIGFVAELFEDLHYFTSFDHNHKADLPAIVTEHFKEEGNCDHANDLPTRVLRDYLFYPVFMAAAYWHSHYSEKDSKIFNLASKFVDWLRHMYNKKETISEQIPSNTGKKASISYEDALEKMRGKKPKSNPQLDKANKNLLDTIENHLTAEENYHAETIDDQEDLINISGSGDRLISKLIAANKSSYGMRIFTDHKNCECHTPPVARNMLIRP